MKRLVLSFSAACLLSISTAGAQEPAAPVPPASSVQVVPGNPAEKNQSDMWQYQARPEANDPSLAVRSNAAYKALQRRGRIESRKWYGYSVARPLANPVPHAGGEYSPVWTNTGAPFEVEKPVVVPSLSVTKRPVIKTVR